MRSHARFSLCVLACLVAGVLTLTLGQTGPSPAAQPKIGLERAKAAK
jgi:hypothetical protein